MANLPQISLLYKTDFRHSYASRDLIGVFSSKAAFRKAARQQILKALPDVEETELMNKEEYNAHKKWIIDFFFDKGQTQGLPDFELVFEQVPANTIF